MAVSAPWTSRQYLTKCLGGGMSTVHWACQMGFRFRRYLIEKAIANPSAGSKTRQRQTNSIGNGAAILVASHRDRVGLAKGLYINFGPQKLGQQLATPARGVTCRIIWRTADLDGRRKDVLKSSQIRSQSVIVPQQSSIPRVTAVRDATQQAWGSAHETYKIECSPLVLLELNHPTGACRRSGLRRRRQ